MTRSLFAAAVLFSSAQLFAQYSTSAPITQLSIVSSDGDPCHVTWYDPDIYLLPDAETLTLLAHGNNDRNSCQPYPTIDAIWPAARSATGSWSTPASMSCPRLKGSYQRCQYTSTATGPIGSPSVVRLANSNSPNGQRYFMAFVGGNGDFIEGRLYWARSDDGVNWTVYNAGGGSEGWTPILQANYTQDPSRPHSTPPCAPPSAITQINLAQELGWMYVFVQYNHPVQPAGPYSGFSDAKSQLLFRFQYSSSQPWGFVPASTSSPTPRWRVYHDTVWTAHSGKMVFRYDVNTSDQQLPAAVTPETGGVDPILDVYNSAERAGMEVGAGALEYGAGKWLRAYNHAGYGQTRVQTTTCLNPVNGCVWSAAQIVDLGNIRGGGFSNTSGNIMPGIHYGSLPTATGRTGQHWWIWVPVPTNNQVCPDGNPYAGLSLVYAQLCTPDTPCGDP